MPLPTSTRDLGARAEARAARYLADHGFEVIERNFRCRAGELDIIARERDVLAFVEVRSRRSARYGHALTAVSVRKRHQVAKIAACYLRLRAPTSVRYRFDVIAITGDELVLVRDAFRL